MTQTALIMLQQLLLSQGGEWSDCLTQAVSLYCILPHSVLKMSPNYALFGCNLRLFGTPLLVSPTALPPEQLLDSTLAEDGLADCCIRLDKYAAIAASFVSQRAMD